MVIFIHILILAILAIPIVMGLLQGQPGQHQATAAAWAVGLLMMAGLWIPQAVISTGLLIWRYRRRKPSVALLFGLHIISALLVVVGALIAMNGPW